MLRHERAQDSGALQKRGGLSQRDRRAGDPRRPPRVQTAHLRRVRSVDAPFAREVVFAEKRRIYVESDPFASQIKVAEGDGGMIATLAAHDTLFTFGEGLDAPDGGVPIEKFRWLPTRQPVALELWDNPHRPNPTAAYNTITTWHNQGKDIVWRGDTWYWTKDREFEKFLDLPRHRPAVEFELAATVDEKVQRRLRGHGWRQIPSLDISRDIDRYRDYIRQSRG